MRTYFLVFFTLLALHSFSQDKIIEGRITDKSDKPVSGATIVVSSVNDGEVFEYAITDQEGLFQIKSIPNVRFVIIKVSHLGYTAIKEKIQLKDTKTTYDAVLEVNLSKLDAVIIKAKKIRDTMRLLTDSLKLTDRSTLRDILEQTDGFIVTDNGSISFRGKQIKKILINKKEVFVNQNKTALDNLDYGIMDDVQLINNYRDKFNVDFDNFTESVLNVDTKEKFKGILKASGEVSYGLSDKYGVKAKAFFFSDQLNMFFTNNTNNFGEKDFSFKDVATPFKSNSSSFFKEQVTQFFSEDELAKNAFDSNTGLTLRKEGDKYRAGLVVYYNNMSQENERELSTTNTTGELVKEETHNLERSGDLLSLTFALNYLLGKKTALNLENNFAYTHSNNTENLFIKNLLPQQNTINETIEKRPKTLILDNSINTKSLITEKVKLTGGLSNSYENSENNFLSRFTVFEPDTLRQDYAFKNSNLLVFFELEKRYNKLLALSGGMEATFFEQRVSEEGVNSQYRKGWLYEPYLLARGQKNSWEYSFRIGQQIHDFSGKGRTINRRRPAIASSITYKPNGNNDIRLNYSQQNRMPDLYNGLDTLNISFNERLLGARDLKKTVSSSSELQLGYYYSNLAKSQSYSISYTREVSYDYIKPIFSNRENSVFYYKNFLIDKKSDNKIELKFGKGFYFTDKYHKIRFYGGLMGNLSRFPTQFNGERLDYSQESLKYDLGITFEPQKFIIDQVKLKAVWDFTKLLLDDDQINTQNNFSFTGNITRKKDNLEFGILGGFRRFKSAEVNFIYPILDLNMTIVLSNKIDVFTKGQNLLHLLNASNTKNTGLRINSDGNFINKNVNRFNLNYFLIGISYKP